MLLELELTNFKKIRNKKLNFAEGFNLLRGENEAGKTTVFEAVVYLYWGARALPMSLGETVTWGEPATSLMVKGQFLHDGVTYTAQRSSAGARLSGSNGVTVNGQTEVSNYISNLFKVNQAIAQSVMVVGQSSLVSIVEGNSGSLIETLAQMDLIPDLIGAIQAHFPTGNTKALETQLFALTNSASRVPECDLTSFIEIGASAFRALEIEKAEYLRVNQKLNELEPLVEPAQKLVADEEAYKNQQAKLRVDLDKIQALLKTLPKPVILADLSALEVSAAEQTQNLLIAKAEADYKAILPSSSVFQNHAEFQTELSRLTGLRTSLLAAQRTLDKALITARSMIITDNVCRLCHKDLTDVPEVVNLNLEWKAKFAEEQKRLDSVEARQAETESLLVALNELLDVANRNHNLAVKHPDYIKSTGTRFPTDYEFVGVYHEVDMSTNWSQALAAANKQRIDNQATEQQTQQLLGSQAQVLSNIHEPLRSFNTDPALKTLADVQVARREVTAQRNRMNIATANLATAEKTLALEQARVNAEIAAHAKAVADKQQLEAVVNTTLANNQLVKKLREAGPVVVKNLWAMVLHVVDTEFSQIRGVASVVTQTEDGFQVDGKPARAYSGSTKDALGLALRIALQKIFLPNVGFMMLDEPASAMNEVRESQLISTVVNAGFKQVIMITHSQAADVYATNLIELEG